MKYETLLPKIANLSEAEQAAGRPLRTLDALRQAGYRVVRERDGDRYFLARENELQPLLVKLGEIAEVRFGIKTGANEFFYLGPVRSADILPTTEITPTYMDPYQPISKRQGARLPHWSQQGATYFVTFRLADSLPQSVVRAWKAEREALMRMVQSSEQTLIPAQRKRLHQLFSEKVDRYLNAGYGACWMKRNDIAEIVANALRYFDGQRYYLWA